MAADINMAALCKGAGKYWNHYQANQSTKDFLAALSSEIGIPISDLVQSEKGNGLAGAGTWVHPQVAVHLGQWASPVFAVQATKWVVDFARLDSCGYDVKPVASSKPSTIHVGGLTLTEMSAF
jgi:hypothetical protein